MSIFRIVVAVAASMGVHSVKLQREDLDALRLQMKDLRRKLKSLNEYKTQDQVYRPPGQNTDAQKQEKMDQLKRKIRELEKLEKVSLSGQKTDSEKLSPFDVQVENIRVYVRALKKLGQANEDLVKENKDLKEMNADLKDALRAEVRNELSEELSEKHAKEIEEKDAKIKKWEEAHDEVFDDYQRVYINWKNLKDAPKSAELKSGKWEWGLLGFLLGWLLAMGFMAVATVMGWGLTIY